MKRPATGVGIGIRKSQFKSLLACERRLDWLEFVPENYVDRGGRNRFVWDHCNERWPLLPHGVSVSLGGDEPLDTSYIPRLKALLDRCDAPYYSDHLCYASLGGRSFYDLLPLPFTDEAVRHVSTRIRELADRLERPIVLENISYYAVMPTSTMTEPQFLSAVLEESGAGLLLDVNNVYVNATNHELDPVESLLALPLDKARHIHLAGHMVEGPRLLDNHGAAVCDGVWDLYRLALSHTGPLATMVEWDTNIPELDVVLDEADKARAIMVDVCGATSPETGLAEVAS